MLVVVFSVINDTYEHLDALTACFPWCSATTARCIPRGSRCKSLLCIFSIYPYSVVDVRDTVDHTGSVSKMGKFLSVKFTLCINFKQFKVRLAILFIKNNNSWADSIDLL